ncbi:MAG: ectonucleotide pyrophosphatase/phosphodiesterase [Spirochaetia bacterium]|jgi:predicted AlkP superfamily pyrophosphatase or phosphodiesterase|nr:ectonucleotide pyrophosphatase/phosphodiesterase [Spirochaetia bacterium]
MEKKRLMVISLDATVQEDLAYLRTLPNYRKYFSDCCSVSSVESIYPSITYPAHTTIATGCYPAKHGIVANCPFEPQEKTGEWVWDSDGVKREDIFSLAKKLGYSTGSVFWPVTGKNKNIDYLIDEYWLLDGSVSIEENFRRRGSGNDMLDIITKNKHLIAPPIDHIYGKDYIAKQPEIDSFQVQCAVDVIERYAPEVMFLHVGIIDSLRHEFGLFNAHVHKGIEYCDAYLGAIGKALEHRHVLDDTDFVVLSDHGQMDIQRILNFNVFLADAGYIKTDKLGNVTDWTAYSQSTGMSGLVYMKHPDNRMETERLEHYLHHLADEGIYGISQVFDKEAAHERGLAGDFSFVIETDGYTSFGESCIRPVISSFDTSDYRRGHATHGYLPSKGPQPIFFAKGPSFKKGAILKQSKLVDEAPTFAAILGGELKDTDGTALKDLLV